MEGFFLSKGKKKKVHFPLMHVLCRSLNGGNALFSMGVQTGRVLPQRITLGNYLLSCLKIA